MTTAPSPVHAVIAAIDALNATDPRVDVVAGVETPRELLYAQRMSACLTRLYPDAPEDLRIAARAQHLCRWDIPRARYPLGREGYNAWRTACRDHHVALASDIMGRHGYTAASIAHVAKMIKKEDLKRDPGSQALENVAAVVFVEHYMAAFATAHPDYDDAKLVGIVKKTLRKMDPIGHAAVHALHLPANLRRIVTLAGA